MSAISGTCKRAIDIVLALLALLVLSPIMLVLAATIWITMGSPIIFRQLRPGLCGAGFTIYKFRTMTETRYLDGKALPDSLRLTRLGRFARSLSLDELPELWNVLKGDMSLVGPRPLLMEYLDLYSPGQARRHLVKPGITGLAQIEGRNSISWEERFNYDTWYVDNHNIALDLKILCLTIQRVVTRKNINQRGQATMQRFLGSGGKDGR